MLYIRYNDKIKLYKIIIIDVKIKLISFYKTLLKKVFICGNKEENNIRLFP